MKKDYAKKFWVKTPLAERKMSEFMWFASFALIAEVCVLSFILINQ